MELSELQKKGLDIAVQRYRAGQRYTVVAGYAGSGKSTLVKFIIAALQVPEDRVVYTCFTGKACNVLQQKGCKNVSTLHRLLYDHFPREDGTFFRKPVEVLDYDVVVVDECSMMPKDLARQLFKHDVYILALGDPFQLPSINPEDDNHLLDAPHIFLSGIHRQAQESEIIRLSMEIREQKPLPLFDGKDVKVISRADLVDGMYTWADQILCAKNETRIAINNQMREMLGRQGEPQEGDKVICLKNEWGILDSNGDPLVNGTIGYLKNVYSQTLRIPFWLDGGGKFDIIHADLITETGSVFQDLRMDKQLILTGKPSLDWKTKYRLSKNEKTNWMVPTEFTYGYVVTYWKAQGSQWNKVLVLEENFPFEKMTHMRAMYTALTRASSKCVMVKKD